MGRVNSFARIKNAAILGCDSVDGTCIAFAPDRNTKIVLSWLNDIARQPSFKF
tara:strand:+ start:518 stop:676 length:159 start_codon:yes stop_codon:yes gene_type:complete